jgi:hypothetical protein
MQKEEVKGLIASFVAKVLMDEMNKTYPKFNEALRNTVENR